MNDLCICFERMDDNPDCPVDHSRVEFDYAGDYFTAAYEGEQTIIRENEVELFRLEGHAPPAEVFATLIGYHIGFEKGVETGAWVERHRPEFKAVLGRVQRARRLL